MMTGVPALENLVKKCVPVCNLAETRKILPLNRASGKLSLQHRMTVCLKGVKLAAWITLHKVNEGKGERETCKSMGGSSTV